MKCEIVHRLMHEIESCNSPYGPIHAAISHKSQLDPVHTYHPGKPWRKNAPGHLDASIGDIGYLLTHILPPSTTAGTYSHAEKTYTPDAPGQQP